MQWIETVATRVGMPFTCLNDCFQRFHGDTFDVECSDISGLRKESPMFEPRILPQIHITTLAHSQSSNIQ